MRATTCSMSFGPTTRRTRRSFFRRRLAPGFVDHVDGLVGKIAVIDMPRRQFRRRPECGIGVADVVVLLIVGLQTLKNLVGFLDARFLNLNLLEASAEGPILFEMVLVFLVGCRPDAAEAHRRPERV